MPVNVTVLSETVLVIPVGRPLTVIAPVAVPPTLIILERFVLLIVVPVGFKVIVGNGTVDNGTKLAVTVTASPIIVNVVFALFAFANVTVGEAVQCENCCPDGAVPALILTVAPCAKFPPPAAPVPVLFTVTVFSVTTSIGCSTARPCTHK